MQYLSDDVIVTGGSQTVISYRTVLTSLSVADATWIGVSLLASGIAKSGSEVFTIGFSHSEVFLLVKSLIQPGVSSPASRCNSFGVFLLVLDASVLGFALLCRSLACVDSVTLALGLARLELASAALDFSNFDVLFPLQNVA